MKKYLPIIIFIIGLGVVTAAAFFIIKSKKTSGQKEETTLLKDLPLSQRPVGSLIPSEDGHWLKLIISKINIEGAASLDYELLYKLPDGRTQGVPGTIKLVGQKEIERDLLLGSESSGKFRYDEGVKEGTLTLRFRNEKGKLIAKFSTQFHLQSNTRSLSSIDRDFLYSLEITSKAFFVTMQVFGLPGEAPGEVTNGPYGVFSSATSRLPGDVKLGKGTVYRWAANKWTKLSDSSSPDIGIFIATSD